MAFLPNNVYGRLGAPVTQALRRAALADDARGLRRAAERVVESAANGDTWQERMAAFSFLADRMEGKAIARLETTSTDAKALDLAQVVQAVLSARSAQSEDAQIVNVPVLSESVGSEDSAASLPRPGATGADPTSPEGATP